MEQVYSPLPLLDIYRLTNEKPSVRNELSLLDSLAREFLHVPKHFYVLAYPPEFKSKALKLKM